MQPPEPPALARTKADLDHEKLVRSIATIEDIMMQALSPTMGLTPGQLGDLAEMFVTLMYLKKVHPEYWTFHSELPMEIQRLCAHVSAEYSLSKVEGLPEATKATLASAIELSTKEIAVKRAALAKEFMLLRQIPMPGTTIH